MRDVSGKARTLRTAEALATLKISPATIAMIRKGETPKGDPLPVAKVAAIQAAKNTSAIIPYCHPIPVEFVGVEFTVGEETIEVSVTVKAVYRTGVEMEALTAAAVAALTIYDMVKMVDDAMEIVDVRLREKKGGKSDFKESFETPLRAAILVASDSVSGGQSRDRAGAAIERRLKDEGLDVVELRVVADEPARIKEALIEFADVKGVDLVVTTGGTGIGPRDTTPEALGEIIDKELPGVAETLRVFGQERTPRSMLSRSRAGLRGSTLLVSLPGSTRAVSESLDALFPGILHSYHMMRGKGHGSEQEKRDA